MLPGGLIVPFPGAGLSPPPPPTPPAPPPSSAIVPQPTTYSISFTDGLEHGDPLSILEGGDELGALAQAVLISLLSWRRAEPGDALPVADTRNGWWADAFAGGDLFGSRLWLLGRSRLAVDTPAEARQYATEALSWLVADGLAAAVEVEAIVPRLGVLALTVTVYRDKGPGVVLRFSDLWSSING